MKKSRKTKRVLIPSILAVILCVAMLVGTTFAWFTDTASTSVNKIQAGTLDVDLEMATEWNENGGVKTWKTAEGETLNFVKAPGHQGETVLWEPGVTYTLPELRIRNNGNLALKYKVLFNAVDTNAEDLELAEVINVIMKIEDGDEKPVGTLA